MRHWNVKPQEFLVPLSTGSKVSCSQTVDTSLLVGKVKDRQTYSVCFQVSSRWGQLPLLNRMCTVGPCTFEASSRLMLVSTAVWPAALLEPPLPLLLWMLEVRQDFRVHTVLKYSKLIPRNIHLLLFILLLFFTAQWAHCSLRHPLM